MNKKIIFLVVVGIVLISIIDTLLLKLYDLSSKQIVSSNMKKIYFCAIFIACFSLQLIVFKYTKVLVKNEMKYRINFSRFNNAASIAYCLTAILISVLIFQLFYFNYYNSLILLLIILTTYGSASFFIAYTSILFVSWYRRQHNFVILLYFISMSLILLNLILTSMIVNLYLIDRPNEISEYIGGTMDLSAEKYNFLVVTHKFTSVLSFLSIWITTVVFSYTSRDELVRKLRYLIMPSLLLVYFLIGYFSQDILFSIFSPFLQTDPILFSTILLIIFTLIKPIGGIMFGIAFWSISKAVNYERTLEMYLIITAYGFVLLFTGNQSTSLVLGPYPPFGTITITILITGSYLVMLGIYTSAFLVSKNKDLRRTVHKIANESKLLGQIGKAEMEKQININVNKIIKEVRTSGEFEHSNLQVDKEELKDYLSEVLEELRKKRQNNS